MMMMVFFHTFWFEIMHTLSQLIAVTHSIFYWILLCFLALEINQDFFFPSGQVHRSVSPRPMGFRLSGSRLHDDAIFRQVKFLVGLFFWLKWTLCLFVIPFIILVQLIVKVHNVIVLLSYRMNKYLQLVITWNIKKRSTLPGYHPFKAWQTSSVGSSKTSLKTVLVSLLNFTVDLLELS